MIYKKRIVESATPDLNFMEWSRPYPLCKLGASPSSPGLLLNIMGRSLTIPQYVRRLPAFFFCCKKQSGFVAKISHLPTKLRGATCTKYLKKRPKVIIFTDRFQLNSQFSFDKTIKTVAIEQTCDNTLSKIKKKKGEILKTYF